MTKATASKPPTRQRHSEARKRLQHFEQQREFIVETIRELVGIESPSDNKSAVDRVSVAIAEKFAARGGRAHFHHATDVGNHLQVDFDGDSDRKPILLLGHYDTVYPLGTLAAMPCRIASGRLWGPGVLDMKSGIALMLHAIEALQAWLGRLPRPVSVLLVSDEEIGSDSSPPITEALAKQSVGRARARAFVWFERSRQDRPQRRGRI